MDMETERRPDIFDRIMARGFLKRFEPFYKAHKEVLLYLFFGVCTTVVAFIMYFIPVQFLNLGTTVIFGLTVDLDTQTANVISWICGVAFAYVTNRIWVFDSRVSGFKAVVKECAAFCAGRLFTLIVENILINICVVHMGIGDITAKILASVVTVILNYVISKLFIFKPSNNSKTSEDHA